MIYIYSRVSTEEQDCTNQSQELKHRYPESELVEEVASGAKSRPKLEALLQKMGNGDTLVVMALDRIGRSLRDILNKLSYIQEKGIILVSLREGLDLTTPMGRFSMTIIAAVSELERGLISERTKQALKIKKQNGKKLGRPIEIESSKLDKIKKLHKEGRSSRDIGRLLGISSSSVLRYIKDLK